MTYLRNSNTGLIMKRSDGVPFMIPLGANATSYPTPRLSLTISGVDVEIGTCCEVSGNVSIKITQEFNPTNRTYCLPRISNTAWRDSSLDAEAQFSCHVGGITATRTGTTQVCWCGNKWKVLRYISRGNTIAGFPLFYGETESDCFPVVVENQLTKCAIANMPQEARAHCNAYTPSQAGQESVSIGSGGTATIDALCCGDAAVKPVYPTVTAADSSGIRDCCEVYKLTLGGGTPIDGVYVISKFAQGPLRWHDHFFRAGAGTVTATISSVGINWGITISQRTIGLTRSVAYTQPIASNACPGTTGWTLSTNQFTGTSPTLTVERFNCWS